MPYTSIDDVIKLFRPLGSEERDKAEALIEVVEARLKLEAEKAGKDLDELLSDASYGLVYKSVVADVVGRTLMTSTDQEPMIQSSESALGYSWSGTFLVPGGGLFIKRDELDRLGFKRQKYGVIEFYETDPWDNNNSL